MRKKETKGKNRCYYYKSWRRWPSSPARRTAKREWGGLSSPGGIHDDERLEKHAISSYQTMEE